MSFSNLNLLPQALSLIPPVTFQYRKFAKNTIDEFGQAVIGYGEWIEAYGIVVPAGKAMQNVEGLHMTPNRVNVFIKGVELDATCEQRSPDQVRFLGRIYNVIQVNDWFAYDDFHNVIAQEVKNIDEADPYSPYRILSPRGGNAGTKRRDAEDGIGSVSVVSDVARIGESDLRSDVVEPKTMARAKVNEYGEVVYE